MVSEASACFPPPPGGGAAYFCLLGVCLLGTPSWSPPVVTSSGSHCSGRYAFYWNAFLLQVCIPVGWVPSAAVAMSIPACTGQGGVCPGGCLPGEVSAQGWCLPGGCFPACTEADNPLWTEWLTDRCKNITFPLLRLRKVNITIKLFLSKQMGFWTDAKLNAAQLNIRNQDKTAGLNARIYLSKIKILFQSVPQVRVIINFTNLDHNLC